MTASSAWPGNCTPACSCARSTSRTRTASCSSSPPGGGSWASPATSGTSPRPRPTGPASRPSPLLSLIHAVTQEVSSRAEPPDLSRLTEIVYGASPIRPDLLERAVAVLGCRFRQNYASSETGPLPITSLPPEDHDPARGRLGTAGRPSLGWEVRLGERGEIQVRGAAPLPGYWNDPEATARSLTTDGFYRTGDVGRTGADGYLTSLDRLSHLGSTRGENVHPAEVEAVLAGHPAVADVAVIGIPDERWGETVHAVVVLAHGADGAAGIDGADGAAGIDGAAGFET